MRLIRSRILPLAAAAALALPLAGCGGVNDTIDKAQACLEAPKIITELTAEIAGLANDPAAMEKALTDAAGKLNGVADSAANTTLKEASDNLASKLAGLNVNSANEAVDAIQQVGTDTVAYLDQVRQACS